MSQCDDEPVISYMSEAITLEKTLPMTRRWRYQFVQDSTDVLLLNFVFKKMVKIKFL